MTIELLLYFHEWSGKVNNFHNLFLFDLLIFTASLRSGEFMRQTMAYVFVYKIKLENSHFVPHKFALDIDVFRLAVETLRIILFSGYSMCK